MAQAMFDVACPCCEAILKIDPETCAVIAHTVPVKPPLIEDLPAEVAKLKGAGDRREQLFQKQFEAEKSHGKVLEKKFDELFKRAKENPGPIVSPAWTGTVVTLPSACRRTKWLPRVRTISKPSFSRRRTSSLPFRRGRRVILRSAGYRRARGMG